MDLGGVCNSCADADTSEVGFTRHVASGELVPRLPAGSRLSSCVRACCQLQPAVRPSASAVAEKLEALR